MVNTMAWWWPGDTRSQGISNPWYWPSSPRIFWSQHQKGWNQMAAHVKGLVQDCSNSSALAMELLQACTKPSMCITSTISSHLLKNTNFWFLAHWCEHYMDGLVQDCSNSSALAMELLQACTKPLICICRKPMSIHACTLYFCFL